LIVRDPGSETYSNTTNAPIPILSSQPGAPGAMTAVAPGEIVTVPGRIILIRNSPSNFGFMRSKNCDISLNYFHASKTVGRIQLRSSLSYLAYWGSGQNGREKLITNYAGRDYYPRVRMQSSCSWARGAWGANLTNNYVGPRGDINRDYGVEIEAYSTYDAQVSYEFDHKAKDWIKGTKLTLGVENLMDSDPPLTFQSYGYRPGDVRRPAGRFFYAAIKKEL
jgi:hypothetical protein